MAPLTRTLYALALQAALLAGPAWADAPLRPGKLAKTAVVWAKTEDGARAAAVDDKRYVWLGKGTLSKIGRLRFVPTGVAVDTVALAWKDSRTGLLASTRAVVMGPDGTHQESVTDAPLLGKVVDDRTALLLFPGQLLRMSPGAPPRAIPLPTLRPTGLEPLGDGRWKVQAKGWKNVIVDVVKGCVEVPEDAVHLGSSWRRARWAYAAAGCGLTGLVPDQVTHEATALAEAKVVKAIQESDLVTLTALGLGGVEGLARARKIVNSLSDTGKFKSGGDEVAVTVDGAIVRRQPVAIINPAPIHLGPPSWTGSFDAPACRGSIVLVSPSGARARLWEDQIQRLQRASVPCAQGISVRVPDGNLPAEFPVTYLGQGRRVATEGGSQWTGVTQAKRTGGVTVARIRMDLATMGTAKDPAHTVAQAPELSPAWKVGPGPGGAVMIDVDGSWIASAGFDLLRGTPKGLRIQRVPMAGPITHVDLTEDGRYRVISGGHGATVLFEGGQFNVEKGIITWDTEPPVDPLKAPPRPVTQAAGWRFESDTLFPATTGSRPHPGIQLGSTITRVELWAGGAIVETALGLVGINTELKTVWRLTDVVDWRITDDYLIATVPEGIRGYLMPR